MSFCVNSSGVNHLDEKEALNEYETNILTNLRQVYEPLKFVMQSWAHIGLKDTELCLHERKNYLTNIYLNGQDEIF